MEKTLQDSIDSLNETLSGLPYKLMIVNPKDLKLLDKNARYMSHEMFQQLVKNIKGDGVLTSIPLCYKEENGDLRVISGNHRVQAAVHDGIEKILALVIDRRLTRQELVAIQLLHNAIEGKDDPVILRELWNEIEDIDLKLYTGLDSEIIREMDKMEFITISETRLDFKQMVMTFFPEDVDKIKSLMEYADMLFSGDEHFLLSKKHYDQVFALLIETKDRFNIVNNPTAFMKIIEMAKLYMDSKQDPPS
jgi:mRNA-degrading endonuclease RelE of RelBE toxin-antitoxin system